MNFVHQTWQSIITNISVAISEQDKNRIKLNIDITEKGKYKFANNVKARIKDQAEMINKAMFYLDHN